MIRLTCLQCKGDSYRLDVDSFGSCPYCGNIFSGSYGSDRRAGNRTASADSLKFIYNGKRHNASVLDISDTGMCLALHDDTYLAKNVLIDLIVDFKCMNARVIWTDITEGLSRTGVRIESCSTDY
ncbi:MAG: PilZ domain-containing protein [Nitrospira sp.]|nr:PilZ domain-containing protein [Nitrospira sp.]